MSITRSIKSALGIGPDQPTYECEDCGSTFESGTDPDSHWFTCPECGSDDPLDSSEA